MPFLAAIPLIGSALAAGGTAALGGAAAAAGGAAVNAITQGGSRPGNNPAIVTPNLQNPVTTTDANNARDMSVNGINQQQALVNALGAQNGVGNQSSVFNQQQGLADQLGLMAQGQGPNPALDQLANTTGANNAATAALMAGQRGAGSNAGLLARQAGQAGAQNNQNAAGQAAVLRANQQLASINALQQQQGMLGGLATTQVGQQQQGVGQLNNNLQNLQQMQLDQLKSQNANAVSLANTATNANAGLQKQQSDQNHENMKGLSSGIGTAVTTALNKSDAPKAAAKQADPIMVAQGGEIGMPAIMKENYTHGPKSKVGQHFFAQGGAVKSMQTGGAVPGMPKVGGAKDSYSNDTVEALLSPGEIVLPRSVTKSASPAEAAKKFVEAIQAKKGKK